MNIYEQLTRDEGLRLKPYTDTVGKTTIGVGRNLTDVGIREEEADFMLRNDVAYIANRLSGLLAWYSTLDEARRGALLNMAFNLGIAGLFRFPNFLDAVSKSDWPRAKDEMLASKWATQVGDRAQRLAEQILTGVWQ